jgi:hypothetical protein
MKKKKSDCISKDVSYSGLNTRLGLATRARQKNKPKADLALRTTRCLAIRPAGVLHGPK